jgi:hypothetical protein
MHGDGQETAMILPRFPEFKLLGLEDRDLVSDAIARRPSEVCELTFANLFIWRQVERPRFTLIHNNLCILCEPPTEPAYFLPPVGGQKIAETLSICLSAAPRISRAPADLIQRHGGPYRCEPDRDNFDYVYRTEDLITLQGKKYDGKRNHIRRFERSHSYQYARLAAGQREGCRALLDEWLAVKAANGDSITGSWKRVIQEAFAHLDQLELVGAVIETDGRIVAFSIGGRLNPDTAVIHIEIVHPDYDGLSQLINREFVRREWSDCRFINREQDCGISGLRRAKLSYSPHHLVEKYNIWR